VKVISETQGEATRARRLRLTEIELTTF
jgi:hypothetical protein